jgi:hypothetical protein
MGAAFGVGVFLPLVVLALLTSGALHLWAPSRIERVVSLALLFAGLPALLAGIGAARLAAHRAAEQPVYHVLRTAVANATLSAVAAGAGLIILIGVPLGGMPDEPARWALVALLGGLFAAPAGTALGWWVARRSLY